MKKIIDYTNKEFGRLKVISFNSRKNKKTLWNCVCSCGKKRVVCAGSLQQGLTKSCGCHKRDLVIARSTKHNGCGQRLYSIWQAMKTRCSNSNVPHYKNYGGRGIKICDEWKDDFAKFQKWALKSGYKENLTIDRIDNNKGYFKENCRWATLAEQQKNRRDTVLFNGENASEAAKRLGGGSSLVRDRINLLNWSKEKAFVTSPIKSK